MNAQEFRRQLNINGMEYSVFDINLLEEKGIDGADVSHVIAKELLSFDGIAYAIPTTDIAAGRVPDGPVDHHLAAAAECLDQIAPIAGIVEQHPPAIADEVVSWPAVATIT